MNMGTTTDIGQIEKTYFVSYLWVETFECEVRAKSEQDAIDKVRNGQGFNHTSINESVLDHRVIPEFKR